MLGTLMGAVGVCPRSHVDLLNEKLTSMEGRHSIAVGVMRDRIEKVEAKLQGAEAEKKEKEEQVASLQSQLTTAQHAIAVEMRAKEAKGVELAATKKVLEAALAEAKQTVISQGEAAKKVVEVTKEKLAKFMAEMKAKDHKLQLSRKEVKYLRGKLSEKREAVSAAWRSEDAVVAELKGNKNELEVLMYTIEDLKADLQKKAKEAAAAAVAARGVEDELTNKANEAKEANQRAEVAEQALSDMRELLDTAVKGGVAMQLAAVQAETDAKQQVYAAKRQVQVTLKQLAESKEREEKAMARLKSFVPADRQVTILKGLKAKLEADKGTMAALKGELLNAQENLGDLQVAITSHQETAADALAKLEDEKKASAKLRKELEECKATNTEVYRDLDQARDVIRRLNADVHDLRAALSMRPNAATTGTAPSSSALPAATLLAATSIATATPTAPTTVTNATSTSRKRALEVDSSDDSDSESDSDDSSDEEDEAPMNIPTTTTATSKSSKKRALEVDHGADDEEEDDGAAATAAPTATATTTASSRHAYKRARTGFNTSSSFYAQKLKREMPPSSEQAADGGDDFADL